MNGQLKSPFKFLDAYEWEDSQIFFGREEEIEKLYEMVFQTSLILVYGLSGTGKTSLVQCGLSSRFDGTDWFPFFVRRGDNLVASLQENLNRALPDNSDQSGSIPEKITELYNYYLRPVYLIFDQFEELFILGEEEDRMQQQQEFAKLLKDLLDSELPCKVILIMREEFIAQLYSIEQEVPTIYDHRLRVEPMGFPKISKVIKGSAEAFNIEVADAEIKSIYQNVSSGKFGVQLPYLQVYLDALYRKAFAQQHPKHSEVPSPPPKLLWGEKDIADLGKMDDVLESYLFEKEEGVDKEVIEIFPDTEAGCVRKVLNGMVTRGGTKKPLPFVRDEKDQLLLDLRDDISLSGISESVLSFVIIQLMDARLLRERDGKIELAHDSLALIIDERKTSQERELGETLRRIEDDYVHFKNDGVFLSELKLLRYEQDLAGGVLRSEISNFIMDSKLEVLLVESQSKTKLLLAERQVLKAEWILLNNENLVYLIKMLLLSFISMMVYIFVIISEKNSLFEAFFYLSGYITLTLFGILAIVFVGAWVYTKSYEDTYTNLRYIFKKINIYRGMIMYKKRVRRIMEKIESNLAISVEKSDEFIACGYLDLAKQLVEVRSYVKSLPGTHIIGYFRMSTELKNRHEEVVKKIESLKSVRSK